MTFNELKETFELLGDWEDRYKLLIDMGRSLPPMDEKLKTPHSKVEGCTSQVWLVPLQRTDKRFDFIGDSDALIVKGLIAVLHVVYAGQNIDDIGEIDIEQKFKALGLEDHLTPNRRNGFFSMVQRIKALAAQAL